MSQPGSPRPTGPTRPTPRRSIRANLSQTPNLSFTRTPNSRNQSLENSESEATELNNDKDLEQKQSYKKNEETHEEEEEDYIKNYDKEACDDRSYIDDDSSEYENDVKSDEVPPNTNSPITLPRFIPDQRRSTPIRPRPHVLNGDKYINVKNVGMIVGLLFVGVSGVFINLLANSTNTDNIMTQNDIMKSIQKNFATQDEYLWLAFKSGVRDVIAYNRPVTFIFIYQENSTDTVDNLTHNLAHYAVCNLRDCATDPIVLSDKNLNAPEVVSDYGIIIEKYRSQLEERGVMIIKNLEKIRGVSAQAFHSMCDEFTPLVDRSLFIFTMKVEDLQGRNNMKFIEKFLKSKWNDVTPDTVNALITRITSMILEVKP